MKKFFLIAMLIVISVNAFSQKIIKDEYDDDGSRIILTKQHLFGSIRNAVVYLSLSDYISAGDVDTYALQFLLGRQYKRTLSKGSRLLFKFEDDSIIELENKDYLAADSKKDKIVTYEIKEEYLKKIIEGKVVKLRMENDVDYDDMKIRGKQFSEFIKGLYDSIQNAKKKNKNDLYNNF